MFHTRLSGKAALESGYSFLGKEQVRIVHPGVTKEMEGATPCFQLCLTNLPLNTTDWELRGIMGAVCAINWHIPRVPREGMTHLHCCYALVDFADAAACEQASIGAYQLRGNSLLWYHPSVTTCYRCGMHGHFQVVCPSMKQGARIQHLSKCRDGVSYAAAAKPGHGVIAQPPLCPHPTSQSLGLDTTPLSGLPLGDHVYATWIDTLEVQLNLLSSCFQVLLEHFDGVVRVITSIRQSVENIAKCVSVPSVTESGVKSVIVQPVTASARSLNPSGVEAALIPSPVRSVMLASENVEPHPRTASSGLTGIPQSYSSSTIDPGYTHLSSVEGKVQHLSVMMESLFAYLHLPSSSASGHSVISVPPGTSFPPNASVPLWHQ